jgi:hypothetical protein
MSRAIILALNYTRDSVVREREAQGALEAGAKYCASSRLEIFEHKLLLHLHMPRAQKKLKTNATHYGMRFACPATADTCLEPSMHPLDGCHT